MLCFIHFQTVLVNLIHEQSSSNLYGDFLVAIYFSQGHIWANGSHAQTLKEKKTDFSSLVWNLDCVVVVPLSPLQHYFPLLITHSP
jgi:hypothetical protein